MPIVQDHHFPVETIEELMTEFYNPTCTNERKKEIERTLSEFSDQAKAWEFCLSFFTSTTKETVMMYSLTVLETFILKHWSSKYWLTDAEKIDLRNTLWMMLTTTHKERPSYIVNKLGKLIIDIGRQDWPHLYPNFFADINQIAQNFDTAHVGVMLYQTVFEEFASPRDDMLASKKTELKNLLLQEVPMILNVILTHLGAVFGENEGGVSAPSQSSSYVLFIDGAPRLPNLDYKTHRLCMLCLRSLAHLLSWVPLTSYITSRLLTIIFNYASFGCYPQSQSANSLQSNEPLTVIGTRRELAIQAMICVNEIMSRNCIPPEFEAVLLQLFCDIYFLLEVLTRDSSESLGNNISLLSEANRSFIEKYTEFLNLFVKSHFKRFEANPDFPVMDFLSSLFQYTFKQTLNDEYIACLEVWNIFLEYLPKKADKEKYPERYALCLRKYKVVLMSLAQEIFQRIQFKHNREILEPLNNEEYDADGKTEWQNFLCHNLETAAKICDIIPLDIFGLIVVVFNENMVLYYDLKRFVVEYPPKPASLIMSDRHDLQRLHCSLRDFSSILQCLGRMIEHMCKEYEEGKSMATVTFKRLCDLVNYSSQFKFFELDTYAPVALKFGFIEVHSQLLAAMKAFCPWLAINLAIDGDLGPLASSVIQKVLSDVAVFAVKEIPSKVVHSTAQLLLSIVENLKPPRLYTWVEFENLFALVCNGDFQKLQLNAQILIHRCISNVLLIPWPNTSDELQDWSNRAGAHDTFCQSIGGYLISLSSTILTDEDKKSAKRGIMLVLSIFTDLIVNIANKPTMAKTILYESLQPVLAAIETLFSSCINEPDITGEILHFYWSLFAVLKTRMPANAIERAMQTFLELSGDDHLIRRIAEDDENGIKTLKMLIKLLDNIVSESVRSAKKYLPGVINLCMGKIYPVAMKQNSFELKAAIYELFYHAIYCNWRYFYKSQVSQRSEGSLIGAIVDVPLENEEIFHQIMEAFGNSFQQPDIGIFRQNLEAIQEINKKFNLYSKQYFKTELLTRFLTVLLQCLVEKSHDLLQDEITMAIFNMATIDFTHFFSSFLPLFVSTVYELDGTFQIEVLKNFVNEVDLPSFTQNTMRFANDVRYYALHQRKISLCS